MVLSVLALTGAGAALWLSWRRLEALPPLRRLALVALRAVALACLAAMLLDPVARRAATVESPPTVVLLADRSASMALQDAPQGGSRYSWAAAEMQPGGVFATALAGARVKCYTFGEEVRETRLPLGGEAEETATDLDEALRVAVQGDAGRLAAAVVVVSDGAVNRGPSREATVAWLGQRRVPVHCVGVGSVGRPPDAWVARVDAPRAVRAGSACRVVVSVGSRGLGGRASRVSLSAEGLAPLSQPVELGARVQRRVELAMRAPQPGLYRCRVSLEGVAGEWTADNNRRTFYLRVTPGDRKLLLIGGSPGLEFKFIRRALESLPDLRLTALVSKGGAGFARVPSGGGAGRLPGGAALRGYDAVLLQDVPASGLTAAELAALREFVSERGGGLGVLGGSGGFIARGDGGGALAPALGVGLGPPGSYSSVPVKASEPSEGGELPPAGDIERHEDFPGWPAMPLLGGLNPRPGASVALRAEDGRPLMVVQRYGSGRTLCLLTGGTHRWVLSRDATEASRRGHGAFWRVIAAWLATPPNRTPVALETDRDVYEVGQTARVVVHVTDEGFRPLSGARVAVTAGPAGTPGQTQLAEVPGVAGRYEGGVLLAEAGPVRLTATAQSGAPGAEQIGTDSREVAVEKPQLELADPAQDVAFLRSLAEASGGVYLDAGEARRLGDVLRLAPRRETVAVHLAWARSPWLLAALIGFLGLDWLLRRWWGVG